ISQSEIVAIAKSLEAQSEHPVAKAFNEIDNANTTYLASGIRNSPGEGIAGKIDNKKYYIGTDEFIKMNIGDGFNASLVPEEQSGHCVFLADDRNVIAAFYFVDQVRADISNTINYFHSRGIKTM